MDHTPQQGQSIGNLQPSDSNENPPKNPFWTSNPTINGSRPVGRPGFPAGVYPTTIPPGIATEMMQQAQIQALTNWRNQMQMQNEQILQAQRLQVSNSANLRGPIPVNRAPLGGIPMPSMTRSSIPNVQFLQGGGPGGIRMDNSPIARPPVVSFGKTPSYNIDNRPRHPNIQNYSPEMDELSFLKSLKDFLELSKRPLHRIPSFQGRQIQMHRLFKTVVAFGGLRKVDETRRWNAVAVSMEFTPVNTALLGQLRSLYIAILYPYEQVFINKISLNEVEWPNIFQKQTEAMIPSSSSSEGSLIKDQQRQLQLQTMSNQSQAPFTNQISSPRATNITVSNRPPTVVKLPKANFSSAKDLRIFTSSGVLTVEEIIFLLASKNPYLEAAGLAAFEGYSIDKNLKIQSPEIVSVTIDAVVNLFSRIIFELNSNTSLDEGHQNLRPFDFLYRKAEEFNGNLLASKCSDQSRLESIINLLRNISLRSEFHQILSGNSNFLRYLLLPSLINFEYYRHLTLDMYISLFLILFEILPAMKLDEMFDFLKILNIIMSELKYQLEKRLSTFEIYMSAFLAHPTLENESRQAFSQKFKAYWQQLPSYTFLLLETSIRILSQGTATFEQDVNPLGGNSLWSVALRDLIEVSYMFVEQFSIVAISYSSFIKRVLAGGLKIYNFSDPIFMVPDGGYFELSLVALSEGLKKSRPISGKVCKNVIGLCIKLIIILLPIFSSIGFSDPSRNTSQPSSDAPNYQYQSNLFFIYLIILRILAQISNDMTDLIWDNNDVERFFEILELTKRIPIDLRCELKHEQLQDIFGCLLASGNTHCINQ